MSAKRFNIGESGRVAVVRGASVIDGERVSLDHGEPMEAEDAVALALDLLLAAGLDDAAASVVGHLASEAEPDDDVEFVGSTTPPGVAWSVSVRGYGEHPDGWEVAGSRILNAAHPQAEGGEWTLQREAVRLLDVLCGDGYLASHLPAEVARQIAAWFDAVEAGGFGSGLAGYSTSLRTERLLRPAPPAAAAAPGVQEGAPE